MMNAAAEEVVHAAVGTKNSRWTESRIKKNCNRFWEIVFGDFLFFTR